MAEEKRFQIEPCDVDGLTVPELLDSRRKALARDEAANAAVIKVSDFPNRIQVLYLPTTGRAGLSWGTAVEWTNAGGISDAIERYFGLHGKQLERPRELAG